MNNKTPECCQRHRCSIYCSCDCDPCVEKRKYDARRNKKITSLCLTVLISCLLSFLVILNIYGIIYHFGMKTGSSIVCAFLFCSITIFCGIRYFDKFLENKPKSNDGKLLLFRSKNNAQR